jgi:hypothetical protein
VVLDWDPAGARLSCISALDWWFQPIEAHRMQSSLNNFGAAPNADGTITTVVAVKDPGIINWLETDRLRDIFITGRWQSLPAQPEREGPKLRTRLVKLSQLDSVLPKDIERCSAQERKERNARRLAAYTRRTGSNESRF